MLPHLVYENSHRSMRKVYVTTKRTIGKQSKWKKIEGMPLFHKSRAFSVRRIQYPLKPFKAWTIHKCIGDDVPFLATQTAPSNPIEKNMFKLWEKNQLLVKLSREKQLKHITSIGPKEITLQTMQKKTLFSMSINGITSSTNLWRILEKVTLLLQCCLILFPNTFFQCHDSMFPTISVRLCSVWFL